MKRFFLLPMMLFFLAFLGKAQNTTFVKGDKVVNLGIGFGSILYSGSGYTNRIPPVSASFEVSVKDELFDENSSLGIGGYFGYTGAKWDFMGYGWSYNSIILGPRGSLHYQFIEKLDTYTGLMIGYNVVTSKSHSTAGVAASIVNSDFATSKSGTIGTTSTVGSGIAYSWLLGGRYYFSDNFAGMLELGYGISYINIGIALKL